MFRLHPQSSADEVKANGLKRFIIELLSKFIGLAIGFLGSREGAGMETLVSIGNKSENAKSQLFLFRQSFNLRSLQKPLGIFPPLYLLAPHLRVFKLLFIRLA